MHGKSIGLVWIVVEDFKEAVEFYTKVAGLKLVEKNEEWGWAELEGHDGKGMRLGIAKQGMKGDDPVEPGQNAVITITVDNLDLAVENLQNQGATIVGQIETVPGHVKLQSVRDTAGNLIQFVQLIPEESCSASNTKKHGCGCH